MEKIPSSEITPEHIYLSRRNFMRGAGALTATSLVLAACGPQTDTPAPSSGGPEATPDATPPSASASTDELGDPLTSFDAVTHYNNFYEFSTSKEAVAPLSKDFQASPWTVQVGGMVQRPRTFDVDDLRSRFTQEERIYRLRCVEA